MDAETKASFRIYTADVLLRSTSGAVLSPTDIDWQVNYIGFGRVDCKISEWSLWSVCSVKCGGGLQHRIRTILLHPQGGGKQCPDNMKYFQSVHTLLCLFPM